MNRIAVTTCVALGTMGVLAAATSGVRAGGKASTIFNERDLVVTLVTPTLNQEVLPDLSDPGLNNVITVQFSSILNARDIIDTQNVVNQLSSKVEFLDSNFIRVPGTPTVRKNRFQFDPFSKTTPVLAQGQYTLNLKSSMRNTRGRQLNSGGPDYTTAFSVGTDVYSPVLRKASPVNGQTSIGLFEQIVVTFNEPIDPSSAVGNLFLQDGSTNPPAGIPGTFNLARKGFDIVITPDPCFGYPPKTNVQFLIQGQGSASPIIAAPLTDAFQNKFRRDVSLRWTQDPTIATLFHSPLGDFDELTGIFKLTFQSKGVKPAPAGLRPGGSQMAFGPPYASPCQILNWIAPSCKVSGNCTNYTTNNGLGEMDLRAYITRFNQGVADFSLISILPNTPVRLGRPNGVVFDPRIIGPLGGASDFHTYIYVVDERTQTILVLRSDNFKVIGRLGGFQSPRDVGFSDNTGQSAATLYVSNFGSNELVAVDMDTIAVTFAAQPGSPSPCAAIKDNQAHRKSISVGAGPTEVSADCYLNQRVMCCNSLESSVSIIDVRTNKVLKSYEVGNNPVSCDWNTIQFGGIRVAVIANQGGLSDPNGSASFYINSPPLSGGFLGAGQIRDGIEGTITDGVKNPTHVWGNQKWIDPPPPGGTLTSRPIAWWLSNTGGTTILDLRIQISGTIFGLSVLPTAVTTLNVGLNPSSTCMDPFYPNGVVFTSVMGTGSMTAGNPNRTLDPFPIPVPGIRRLFNTYTN